MGASRPGAPGRPDPAFQFLGIVMDPRDFAGLASRLPAAETPTSAELRTAVSRAYYAAFNVAIDLLAKLGIKAPASWEGHKLVAVALRHCGDGMLTTISHEIDDLRG